MPRLSELTGLWERSLLAWPDGRRDTTTKVLWLQGLEAFGDLRQPAGWADFPHAESLSQLSRVDCERLAGQQAFAGYLTVVGDYFEWVRLIDFQPSGPHPDAGSLRWQENILVEQGRDVPYLEHWHRTAAAAGCIPIAAATLRHATDNTAALLVRVGERLVFARSRLTALPPLPTLRECIDAADSLEHARAMVDCEVSFATASANGFRIDASTLPFRVGQRLHGLANADWQVTKSDGNLAALPLS